MKPRMSTKPMVSAPTASITSAVPASRRAALQAIAWFPAAHVLVIRWFGPSRPNATLIRSARLPSRIHRGPCARGAAAPHSRKRCHSSSNSVASPNAVPTTTPIRSGRCVDGAIPA